jgi:hypothetical protein
MEGVSVILFFFDLTVARDRGRNQDSDRDRRGDFQIRG